MEIMKNVEGFLALIMPDSIWRWDHFTDKYDHYVLGDGQWRMIKDKLILSSQEFIKGVFSYDKIKVTSPHKIKIKANEQKQVLGKLEKEGLHCKYVFEIPFGCYKYTFQVRNIPASSNTKQVDIFFNAVLNYLSYAYLSLESNLSPNQEGGYLYASDKLMHIADSFILGLQKVVLLEYLYYILNFEKVWISQNAWTYKDRYRYNLRLLSDIYEFVLELSSRKIENQEIYTGFIFHNLEDNLNSNSMKRIELLEPIQFGQFNKIKSLIPATNGRNIFFNVTNNMITHFFLTRENVAEITMENLDDGKTFVETPLIVSVQGNGKIIYLQGNTDRNMLLFEMIHNKPIIKDYYFIEKYLDQFLENEISKEINFNNFIKWLLKLPIEKRGTTIIIGDFQQKFLREKLVQYSEVSINESLFDSGSYQRILLDHITKPDGALIFDKDCKLLFMSAILPFSSGKKVTGGGARHQSTINFTKTYKCIGITVSEDGGISLFTKAERISSRLFNSLARASMNGFANSNSYKNDLFMSFKKTNFAVMSNAV